MAAEHGPVGPDQPRWPILVAAIVAAVVGSYSSIQGLLIWPIGLVLLYHRRRPTWAFGSWVAAGLVTVAVYLHNYHANNVSPTWALRHPRWSAKLFVFALGDVVGMQTPHGGIGASGCSLASPNSAITTPGNTAVLLFGVVIVVLAIFVLVELGDSPRQFTGRADRYCADRLRPSLRRLRY